MNLWRKKATWNYAQSDPHSRILRSRAQQYTGVGGLQLSGAHKGELSNVQDNWWPVPYLLCDLLLLTGRLCMREKERSFVGDWDVCPMLTMAASLPPSIPPALTGRLHMQSEINEHITHTHCRTHHACCTLLFLAPAPLVIPSLMSGRSPPRGGGGDGHQVTVPPTPVPV